MIGVFDSGVGGLTFVKALGRLLPQYSVVYFGDTARVPYGNKSPDTIRRYAKGAIDFLHSKGARVIVVACHTASATAGDVVRVSHPVTVFNVLDPIAPEVLRVSKNGRIGIIGTTSTIASRKHQQVLEQFFQAVKSSNAFPYSRLEVVEAACPLFVPLIEEGFVRRPETKRIIRYYLRPLKEKRIDTLVLACTHYPLLRDQIQEVVGKGVTLIDPSEVTAAEVKRFLNERADIEQHIPKDSHYQFYVSDDPKKFSITAKKWLQRDIEVHQVNVE